MRRRRRNKEAEEEETSSGEREKLTGGVKVTLWSLGALSRSVAAYEL